MAQPEVIFRYGTCSALVFHTRIEKDGEMCDGRRVLFRQHHPAGDGVRRVANSLSVSDIPKAVLVLSRAFEYLTSSSHTRRSAAD